MSDVATSRVQLMDNSFRRDDGKRVHRFTGWQVVTLSEGGVYAEPVDLVLGIEPVSATKELTGVLFCDEGAWWQANGVGGDVGAGPIYR